MTSRARAPACDSRVSRSRTRSVKALAQRQRGAGAQLTRSRTNRSPDLEGVGLPPETS